MLDVGADDSYDAFAAYDLAVFTNSADAAANFHDTLSLSIRVAPKRGERSII